MLMQNVTLRRELLTHQQVQSVLGPSRIVDMLQTGGMYDRLSVKSA
jgi:hypothetical protein